MESPSLRYRRLLVIAIYVFAVGWGVQSALATDESKSPWVITFGLAFVCTVWCATDAQARGKSLVWPARIGIFLLALVGLPIYLVWSRGIRGALIAAVAVVSWFAIAFAVFMVTGYAAYGSVWFG